MSEDDARQYIREVVGGWPPLSQETRAELAALLQPPIEREVHQALLKSMVALDRFPREPDAKVGPLTTGETLRNAIASNLSQLDRRLGERAADDRSVYFIQDGNGAIKIGLSADPPRRLAGLQTATAAPLRLLAVQPNAGAEGEKQLHQRFAEAHIRGEWFHPVPELLAYIAENARQS